MPKLESYIKLTPDFYNLDIDKLTIQESPKFLLRSMRHIKKNCNGYFKYKDLLDFMENNYNNKQYYKGIGIKSLNNLNRYWNYANSKKHKAKIAHFKSYYYPIFIFYE